MICPVCGAESEVRDSRTTRFYQRRRRRCLEGHAFTTMELIIDTATMEIRVPLIAIKPSGMALPATEPILERDDS